MVTDNDFDPFVASIAKELKEPVRLDARLDERIMAALEPEVISLDSRRVARARLPQSELPWYRRTFAVPAPLGGLAAAAALAGIAAVGVLALRQTQEAQVAVAPALALTPVSDRKVDPATIPQPVTFIFSDVSARSVALVGDFNDWDAAATPMAYDSAHAAWSISIQLLPGLHEYQFLVDGTKHVNDPTAPMVNGDFGSPNSVVTVRVRE